MPLRIINIEETPDRIVGRRRAPSDPFKMAMGLQALAGELQRSFGNVSIPKGVYRFKTHEEADQWMWTMLARHRTT